MTLPKLRIRTGFTVFLVLILMGIASLLTSTEVPYSWQQPTTNLSYRSEQRSRYIPVYGDNISDVISPFDAISFGPYNAINRPFNEITFNILETASPTYVRITGAANGVVWANASKSHGTKHIPVQSNDIYSIEIQNLYSNQYLFVRGSIGALGLEFYTEEVPYNLTTSRMVYGSHTAYPYLWPGLILTVVGISVGVVTGVVALQSRRRIKEFV